MKRIVWLLLAAVMVACLAGLCFQLQQISALREQLARLTRQCAADSMEMARLNREIDAASLARANLDQENTRLRQAVSKSATERAENARLHGAKPDETGPQDRFTQMVGAYVRQAELLNQHLQDMPAEKIPELNLLDVDDWLLASKTAKLDTDADVRQSLSKLREIAKNKLPFGSALYSYTRANSGNLPTDMSQLAPYFNIPVDGSILSRYSIIQQGNISSLPQGAWVIVETSPADPQYDTQAQFGIGTSTMITIGAGASADNNQ